jgi:hypothetical protein
MGLDLSLDRRVAIKEYFPSELVSRETGQSQLAPYDENSRQSFEQGRERSMEEARTIARLNDVPAAVNVYDVVLANDTLYSDGVHRRETLRARVKAAGGNSRRRCAYAAAPGYWRAVANPPQGHPPPGLEPDNIMLRASTAAGAVGIRRGAQHGAGNRNASIHHLRPGHAPVEQ